MAITRISIRGLTKVFARHSGRRTRGVSTEGPAALKYLLSQTFSRRRRQELPPRDKWHLRALDDVNVDVAGGEVLGIIGRNGAGKSTLLKVLARVLHPTAGRIEIQGRVVSMLELGLGAAPDLSVRQNIHIQGRLAGIPARRIRDAEESILEFSGLARYADTPLKICPSGSPVQLAFATMVGLGAEVVLADEVLAVGDTAFRRSCEERVRNAGESGESVLFVSHDMSAIRRMCTRVIWIDRGRIVKDGPTDEVVDAYTTELLAGRLLPELRGRKAAVTAAALLDLRLLDAEHSQIGALQLSEPGFIDCLFRIVHPGVSAFVELTVTSRRRVVFATRSDQVTARGTATYRAALSIPADFLNERLYQVRVRLRAKQLIDTDYATVAEQQLEFSAMNPHPERSVWRDWQWGRGGLIAPRLDWTVRPADAAATNA